MEKHFITSLLVLILLAPQSGLEAKSRHHGVKERDHDAEERDDEAKKRHRSNRYKKYKNKYRHSHGTKVELELLKQSITEINAKMDALEPPGQLPADLAAKLDALQMAVDANTSATGANTGDISMALDDIIGIFIDIEKIAVNAGEIDGLKITVADLGTRLDALALKFDDLDSRVLTLESSSPPPASSIVFSSDFSQGLPPDLLTKQAWGVFIGNATGDFESIEIKNNLGGSAICSDPVLSTNIASLLNNFTPNDPTASVSCDGRSWNIGDFGDGAALSAGGSINVNDCAANATVRPLINHMNWGGIGITCSAPDQTLEVILTR